MKRNYQNQELAKTLISKSLIGESQVPEKQRMRQSCILEQLMVKSNPDKQTKNEQHYPTYKDLGKSALYPNPYESRYDAKKLSESTHSSMHKNEMNRQKFMQKYKSDMILKHLVNRTIKKYEEVKFNDHVLFQDQNPCGFTLRLQKVNQEIEEAKMYHNYKKYIEEDKA